MEPARTILVSGLGGGLDIVNATLLYHALRHDGRVRLGSVRHIELKNITDHISFADSGTSLKPSSSFQIRGRFIEPRIASLVNEEVIYFSRNFGGAFDSDRLRKAITQAREHFKFDDIIFVDGGGDSLILESSDANDGSETTDPFKGGDSELLTSIVGLPRIYQAVIAVGLDIAPAAFKKNIELLRAAAGYFGRVNLRTGEQDQFTLGNLIAFKPGFLEPYFALAGQVLVLEESQLQHAPQPGEAVNRLPSHTATVTYHALKGEYGKHRTFVPWEPMNEAGERGVNVSPDHCWMYFFDASKVEQVKLARNGRATAPKI